VLANSITLSVRRSLNKDLGSFGNNDSVLGYTDHEAHPFDSWGIACYTPR